MDFSLDEEELAFQRSVLAFAEKELPRPGDAALRAREKSGTFDRAAWDKCAAFGIQGLCVPEEHGGLGKGVVACVLAMQALGRTVGDAGLLFSLCSHMFTCEVPITVFGSPAQKERYLPKMAAGELVGCHAMTEPESGSDAFSLRTSAEKRGDRWILRGAKTFISNAPIADVLLVFATTDRKKGWAGVTGFLVDKGTPGLSVGTPVEKMGLKTSPTGEVVLEDVEVPLDAVLGRPGQGSAIFNAEMEWERSCLFACHLGAMQRQLDACVRYAKERKQFGQSIGSFQGVSHKIADMRVRVELAELALMKVAWMKDRGQRASLESSIAKLFVSEAFVASSLDAIQVHGGYGFTAEYEVERDLRDAVGGKLYSGTSEIQRNVIASLLGL